MTKDIFPQWVLVGGEIHTILTSNHLKDRMLSALFARVLLP